MSSIPLTHEEQRQLFEQIIEAALKLGWKIDVPDLPGKTPVISYGVRMGTPLYLQNHTQIHHKRAGKI